MGFVALPPDVIWLLMAMLVCFSGQIGSGKSSVSRTVADRLGWKRAGFGDFLRAELQSAGGDPTSREQLQDLGQSLITTDAEGFCRRVLAAGGFTPGDNFVLDGVRHVQACSTLQRLARPSVGRLIFLTADNEVLRLRVASRSDAADLIRATAHAVESETFKDLPSIADRVIDVNQSIDAVVEDCLEQIVKWSAEAR